MDISNVIMMFIFLPVCIAFYYFAKPKYRNAVLIVFSLLFYGWFEPVFIWLMLFGVFMNYLFGKMISYSSGSLPKAAFTAGLVMNIGLLAAAKYGAAFVTGINTAFDIGLSVPDLPLPLGMSFFTLRAVSYLADCWQGRIAAEKQLGSFMLYLTMFPAAAYGPVVRYETVQQQLSERSADIGCLSEGLTRIVIGIAKKILFADRLGAIASQFLTDSSSEAQTALGAWYGIIMFTLQIYFDFSAYSDMAIGAGRLFGFRFEENFRHPFMCTGVTDFWNRWHISLVSFFRDYVQHTSVFGGNTRFAGIAAMWLLMGLWHGASLNFVIWGVFFGIVLIAEELAGRERLERIPAAVRHIFSKIIILIGFCLFCFRDMGLMVKHLGSMFFIGGGGAADAALLASVSDNILLIAAAVICCFPIGNAVREYISGLTKIKSYIAVRITCTVITALLLFMCCSVIADGSYSSFILMQF